MSAHFDYTIRTAEINDAGVMPKLENSAGFVFRTIPTLASLVDGEDLPIEWYRVHIASEASLIAVTGDNEPIGFLIGTVEHRSLHIWELGVRHEFQRRGIGRALMEVAIQGARNRHLEAVTLTTFREVPWNAPFYESLGFEQLMREKIDARLDSAMQLDADRGLPSDARCAMRLALD